MTETKIPSSAAGDLRSGISDLVPTLGEELLARFQEQVTSSSQRWIPSARVRGHFGGISDMTLWRWLNDPDLGFPKPIYIARRRYWREADILAWLDAQANKTSE